RINEIQVHGVYGVINDLFEGCANSCLGMLANAQVTEMQGAQQSSDNRTPSEPHCRSPKEFIDNHRRHFRGSYEKLAASMGISKDTLYAITKENRWVSDQTYNLVAKFCGCEPDDLHPRDISPPNR